MTKRRLTDTCLRELEKAPFEALPLVRKSGGSGPAQGRQDFSPSWRRETSGKSGKYVGKQIQCSLMILPGHPYR